MCDCKRTRQPAAVIEASEQDRAFMRRAIDLSMESVEAGGGPFGAVIVRGGRVVSTGSNCVVPEGDPTAHAEVTAIRRAARALGTHDLSGCTIYTSCEPCPMCLGAIYWARLDKVCYGAGREDAARAGFDDSLIYDEAARAPGQRTLPFERLLPDEACAAFRAWDKKRDKTPY